jgi:hypothetical protein
MRIHIGLLLPLFLVTLSPAARAQYNKDAASNAPAAVVSDRLVHDEKTGTTRVEKVRTEAPRDSFGNAQGSQHDLAIDGAFDGQTIAVLHFYTGEGFDFSKPKAALAQKGFAVYRWVGAAPSPEELREKLKKASQLWIISDASRHLNDEHLKVIKDFFDSGRGVYIWGDNEPYYADANAVGQALLGVTMSGNLLGSQTVGLLHEPAKGGVLRNHLLSTGLENVFEGVTIATIAQNQTLTPLIYGSAGNLVTAFYDHEGKRAIFDGGFTRLYCNWDTAGTGRYVKNAAAWLANYERFGDQVVSATFQKKTATGMKN